VRERWSARAAIVARGLPGKDPTGAISVGRMRDAELARCFRDAHLEMDDVPFDPLNSHQIEAFLGALKDGATHAARRTGRR
jgi:hypothetical protein